MTPKDSNPRVLGDTRYNEQWELTGSVQLVPKLAMLAPTVLGDQL